MPDSDSATKNYMETTGFVSGQFWLLTCVIIIVVLIVINRQADIFSREYCGQMHVPSTCNTRVFRLRAGRGFQVGLMRQTVSCLSKLGVMTNFNTVPLLSSLVSIFKGLADFRKFDHFRWFFRDSSAEICRSEFPKNGKDKNPYRLNFLHYTFCVTLTTSAMLIFKQHIY